MVRWARRFWSPFSVACRLPITITGLPVVRNTEKAKRASAKHQGTAIRPEQDKHTLAFDSNSLLLQVAGSNLVDRATRLGQLFSAVLVGLYIITHLYRASGNGRRVVEEALELD